MGLVASWLTKEYWCNAENVIHVRVPWRNDSQHANQIQAIAAKYLTMSGLFCRYWKESKMLHRKHTLLLNKLRDS